MFGERLSIVRKAYHMKQIDLAIALHVSKQTVSNWENGNIEPSVEMLRKTAAFFHVSTDFLLGLDSRIWLEITDLSLGNIILIQQVINNLKMVRDIDKTDKFP